MSTPNSDNSAQALCPTHVNWVFTGGVLYDFEATDEHLLATGLVTADLLPGPVPRCHTKPRIEGGVRKCSRLSNGLVRLTICAEAVIDADRQFKRFLGGLLCDTRLSLVRGESK